MRVFLNMALCKKCPYSVFRICHYKKQLYKKVPKVNSKAKMMHNCTYYRKIYKKGQYVLVDLYHQFPSGTGRWAYFPAHKNVPGVIKGIRGHKFVVELFEVYLLNRKKRGNPHSSYVKICWECARVAKDIRPLVLNRKEVQLLRNIPEKKSRQKLLWN